MERIASFTVNHDVLVPGLYLSRRDGDVTTFDLRFKKPNTGDLLTNAEMHSVEHIIATLLRNSEKKDAVIYFGPMGCQTGFYFLFDGAQLTDGEAIRLLQNANQVSSVCNDVVGDICGIVSGSTAAVIVVQLQRDFSTTSVLISIGVTALISGITIGGKALGKSVAINDCTKVVYRVARIMHALHLYR